MIHAVKRELRVLGSSLCLLSAALLAALVCSPWPPGTCWR